jgi:uncharacterized Rmd1/YagE family protein
MVERVGSIAQRQRIIEDKLDVIHNELRALNGGGR